MNMTMKRQSRYEKEVRVSNESQYFCCFSVVQLEVVACFQVHGYGTEVEKKDIALLVN